MPSGVGRHKSLDIGAVRLTERFLHSDPPTETNWTRPRSYARAAFDTFPAPDTPPLVAGIGGTAVNIAAVTQGLGQARPGRLHGAFSPMPTSPPPWTASPSPPRRAPRKSPAWNPNAPTSSSPARSS